MASFKRKEAAWSRSMGLPAQTAQPARVVVQGARDLEGSLLVGGLGALYLEGNELVYRGVSQLELDVGEHEVSAVGTGQSALGHLRMADGFQLESRDLVLAERVEDPVLVGVRVGALGVDQAAFQNFEGLFLGLGRAGSEARPVGFG